MEVVSMRLEVLLAGSIVLASCQPPKEGGTDPTVEPEGCVAGNDDDEDGIANGLEGCDSAPPRDLDHDGTPDYQDLDSDADGVKDRDEDRNGDGVLGTCQTTCAGASECPPDHACTVPID